MIIGSKIAQAQSLAGELSGGATLSQSQLKIWAGWRLRPDVPMDNMALLTQISGDLEPGAFERAFKRLVAESENLRTIFFEQEGVPYQRVLSECKSTNLSFLDFRAEADPRSAIRNWASEQTSRIFSLELPLFDAALLRSGDSEYYWYFNQHHLITDATTFQLLHERFSKLYLNELSGRELEPADWTPYGEFLDREQSVEKSPSYPDAVEFWTKQSGESVTISSFYGIGARAENAQSSRVCRSIGRERVEKLRRLATSRDFRALTSDFAMSNILTTIYVAYLHRITGDDSLSIGVASRNRQERRFRKALGLFVDLLPLQVSIDDSETFLSLHRKIVNRSLEMFQHALPGANRAGLGGTPSAVINYVTATIPSFAGNPSRTEWIHSGSVDPVHPIRLEVVDFDSSQAIDLAFDLNTEVFPESSHGYVTEHFLATVDSFLAGVENGISDFDISSSDDRVLPLRAVESSSSQIREWPGVTIIERFNAVVECYPERIALSSFGLTLSYRELNKRSNQVATWLLEQGVNSGQVVALFMSRSCEAIVGMLGVLKAGCAYMPLDSRDPVARLSGMLRRSNAVAILSGPDALSLADDQLKLPLLRLSADFRSIENQSDELRVVPIRRDALAYILFTSGSSGEPKAVMIEHRNVLNLVSGIEKVIYRRYTDEQAIGLRVAVVAPFVFDASVQQIFCSLLLGHHLQIVPEDIRQDGFELLKFFKENATDISDGTPGHLRLLLDAMSKEEARPRIQHFVIGGDVMPGGLAREFAAQFNGDAPGMTNVYGVAECCVDSLAWDLDFSSLQTDRSVPIGKTLEGTRAYVLNSGQQHQPVGVVGELYLGGDGVGRGYLTDSSQTRARFIKDPFVDGGRLYRTGDLVRLLSNGAVEFIGRQDSQVKIRGYRIELVEIESALRGIREERGPVTDRGKAGGIDEEGDFGEECQRCRRCLLTEKHPGICFDDLGVCSICTEFLENQKAAESYFKTIKDFERLVQASQSPEPAEYDCLLLYSGGKDSSYVLHRLAQMGLKILAFTFDNGHISASAFRNIRRQTERLGVESIVCKTSRMDEIFVESLEKDQTVCTGCFKALTTISTRIAHERGIRIVITGLSRGQIYDTKLSGLISEGVKDVAAIEEQLRVFRRAYHANQDRTARLLGDDLRNISWDKIEFVDFFRYDETPITEIREYLKQRDSYWRQPTDTGFCSSNCLMNDIGICIHSQERGYHNYEAPLSWDVRLGVLTREEAIPEVMPVQNVTRVNRVLEKIGYFVRKIEDAVVLSHTDDSGHPYLCAYYVASHSFSTTALRERLSKELPSYMIPARFIHVESFPLTNNGKIDVQALSPDAKRPDLDVALTPARNQTEETLLKAWSDVLSLDSIGINDNFFELGGDSIIGIQISSRAAELGVRFEPREMFLHQTVAELACHVVVDAVSPETESARVLSGSFPLTPIQRWFFDLKPRMPNAWVQSLAVALPVSIEPEAIRLALQCLCREYDGLRTCYFKENNLWGARIEEKAKEVSFFIARVKDYDRLKREALSSMSIEKGRMLCVVYVLPDPERKGFSRARLFVGVHHLAMDAVSWSIFLSDLEGLIALDSSALEKARSFPGRSFYQFAHELDVQSGEVAQKSSNSAWAAWGDTTGGRFIERDSNLECVPGCVEVVEDVFRSFDLKDLVRSRRVSLGEQRNILLAAVGHAMMRLSGSDVVRVDIESHGRDVLPESTRVVGWLTARFPMQIERQENIQGTAEWLGERFQSLRFGGAEYGVQRYLVAKEEMSEDLFLDKCEVGFNFLGPAENVLPVGSSLGLVEPLKMSRSVNEVRGNPIEIDVMTEGEHFQIHFDFDRKAVRRSIVEKLADFVIAELRGFCESSSGKGDNVNLRGVGKERLSKALRIGRKNAGVSSK